MIDVIKSMEGSRMGCSLGSFGFDLAVQDLYEAIETEFPDLILKALTDDFSMAILTDDDYLLNASRFRYLHRAMKKLQREARSFGLELNLGKCALLLPQGITRDSSEEAEQPSGSGSQTEDEQEDQAGCANVSIADLFSEVKITEEGLRMGGAPIGTDDFCTNFVSSKVEKVKDRIGRLRGIDAQVAVSLLRKCIVPALVFLSQVTPPTITLPAFARYDSFLADFLESKVLTPKACTAPICGEDRLTKFRKRIRLPLRHRGAGITSMSAIAPAAFFSSVVSSAVADPTMRAHVDGFARFSGPVHRQLAERLGSEPPESVTKNMPDDYKETQTALTDTFYVELLNKEPALKLQKVLSDAIHARNAKLFRDSITPEQKEDFVGIHAHASPMSLLSLPLSQHANRISPPVFITWFRFEFQLPQLIRIGNMEFDNDLGYGVERCVGDCKRRPVLDLHAVHANSAKCKSTAAGRHLRHSLLKWAVHHLAGLAGCRAVIEPPTNRVLLEQYTPQQCRGLFLHHPSKKERAKAKELHEEFKAIFQIHHEDPARAKRIKSANAQLRATLLSRKKKKGLRLDVWITDPTTGDEAFVDMACTTRLRKAILREKSSEPDCDSRQPRTRLVFVTIVQGYSEIFNWS